MNTSRKGQEQDFNLQIALFLEAKKYNRIP